MQRHATIRPPVAQPLGYDRQWLAAIQHPGNTPSASCLRESVAAAETRVGQHPRRRPDLVAGRLAALDAAVGAAEAHVARYSALATAATQQEEELLGQIVTAQAAGWQADPRTRVALAHQIATLQRRLGRLRQQGAAAVTRSDRAAERVARLSAQRPALQAWHDQLVQENTVAEATPRCIVRVDAGFSSGANLSYLLELGYEVETRANNAAVARALRRRVTPTTAWTAVGPGTQMAVWGDYYVRGCPYPLWAGLEQWAAADGPRYTALLRSHPDPGSVTVDPQAWFGAYNGRQTIEAGNKQAQGVFHLQHFWSRSRVGMPIQVALTVFAANFVHWAAEWVAVRTVTGPPTAGAATTVAAVRGAVRVAANSLATLERHDGQVLVRFAVLSGLVGWVICVAGPLVVQLGLPLFGVASAMG